ncbi:MAG: PHP domain-containing protein [Alphaproteobacteria bacterium]
MRNTQTFSYHSHTTFSDGRNSIREMIRRAKEIGFTELGISDHLIVHKNMFQCECWKYMQSDRASHVYNNNFKDILPAFQRHCEEIRKIAKEENFKVLVGYEVDFFPYDGWLEELKEFVSNLDVDYLHSGNHFFCDDKYENIINMTFMKNFVTDKTLLNEYIIRHFDTLRQCVESKMFDFLAHIDYVRRYCGEVYQPNLYWDEKNAVLNALEQNNVALEISTKGLRRINDFYPDALLLDAVSERNIAMLINDDAHYTSELGADFDKAEQALKDHGITKRFKI